MITEPKVLRTHIMTNLDHPKASKQAVWSMKHILPRVKHHTVHQYKT